MGVKTKILLFFILSVSSCWMQKTTDANTVTSPPPTNTTPGKNAGDIFQTLLGALNSPDIQKIVGSLFQNGNSSGSSFSSMLGGLLSSASAGSQTAQKDNKTGTNNILGQFLNNPRLADTIFGSALSSYGATLSQNCQKDLLKTVQGLMSNEGWALEMLDAFGKPESRLAHGNLKWLGSYSECTAIKVGTPLLTGAISKVNGQYCMVSVPLESLMPTVLRAAGLTGIDIGTCFPDTCSSGEVSEFLNAAQKLLNITSPANIRAECLPDSKPLRGDAVAVIVILSIFGLLLILGTLYDVIAYQLPTGKQTQESDDVTKQSNGPMTNGASMVAYVNGAYTENGDENHKVSLADSAVNAIQVSVEANPSTPNKKSMEPPKTEKSALELALLSFSVYTNGVKILNPHQTGSLGALNGIRVLSMAWVILGHTYFFSIVIKTSSNGFEDFFKRYNEQWTFVGVGNATLSVDTFFALSGCLVAYFALKELKKFGGARKFKWGLFYFHRYWRLTPVYMLVIMIGTVILPYVISGPNSTSGYDVAFMAPCRGHWWTNLLYINNYIPAEDICMGWSWYLANDMQFYIISPLLVVPLFYNAAAGIVSCLIFLAATISAVAFVTYEHTYPAQNLAQQYLPVQPKDGDYQSNLYFPSYARMGPYIIGIFTGYLLYKWNCKCRIPRWVNVGCWVLSFCSSSAIIYGVYNHYTDHLFSETESIIYMSTFRTAWGIVVCWVMFACATGHGGWINEVLSWKPFVPLGRLTYAAYLIHPLVMVIFYMGREQLTYFSNYETVYLFLGHMTLSYGAGFLVSLAFEAPMMGLEKVFLKRDR